MSNQSPMKVADRGFQVAAARKARALAYELVARADEDSPEAHEATQRKLKADTRERHPEWFA